jgi:hypothetical protein
MKPVVLVVWWFFLTDNTTTPTKVVLSCFGLLVGLWQLYVFFHPFSLSTLSGLPTFNQSFSFFV